MFPFNLSSLHQERKNAQATFTDLIIASLMNQSNRKDYGLCLFEKCGPVHDELSFVHPCQPVDPWWEEHLGLAVVYRRGRSGDHDCLGPGDGTDDGGRGALGMGRAGSVDSP